MSEWRLFEEGTVPECSTRDWYLAQGHSPHLEQEGQRERLLTTAEMVSNAVTAGAKDIVDLGAGDGGLLQAVRALGVEVPAWGYDLQPPNVAASAGRGVSVELVDVLTEPIRWADLAVTGEMLEHLLDPHSLVRTIHDAGCRWLVASSPYTETPDAHYQHHLWAWDDDGYDQLLQGGGWRIVEKRHAWICQVLLCERA